MNGQSNYAAAIEPATTNPVPGAMGALGSAVHELGLMADTLVNRIMPVLQPVGPQPVPGDGRAGLKEVTQSSPMVDEITSLRRRVENIRGQLQDALNRLEV